MQGVVQTDPGVLHPQEEQAHDRRRRQDAKQGRPQPPHQQQDHREGEIARPFHRKRPGRIVPGMPRAGLPGVDQEQLQHEIGGAEPLRIADGHAARLRQPDDGRERQERQRMERPDLGDAPQQEAPDAGNIRQRPRAVAEPEREARQEKEPVHAQIADAQYRPQPGQHAGYMQSEVEVVQHHPADQGEPQASKAVVPGRGRRPRLCPPGRFRGRYTTRGHAVF